MASALPLLAKGNRPIVNSRPFSLACFSVRPIEAISGKVKMQFGILE